MIAHGIKRVFVQTGGVGGFQAFVEFEIEDLITQRLSRADFVLAASEPDVRPALRGGSTGAPGG